MTARTITTVFLCALIVGANSLFAAVQPKSKAKKKRPRKAQMEALADQVRKLTTEVQDLRGQVAGKQKPPAKAGKAVEPGVEELASEVEKLRIESTAKDARLEKVEKTADRTAERLSKPSVFKVSGDMRTRYDALNGDVQPYMQYMPTARYQPGGPGTPMFHSAPVNGYHTDNHPLTNLLGLNFRADATEDISVKGRLLMYKVWGHETMTPVQGDFFADRAFGVFDGTIGHVPSDNALRVDQAYATINNIGGEPIWFSIGRRPSTGGPPTNVRRDIDLTDNHAGIPAILVDYAFDGLTLGYAPELESLPGFFAKLCYGRGFDSGFRSPSNSLENTDFLGLNVSPYNTDQWQTALQWQRGMNIFNVPSDGINFFGMNLPVTENLGDIDWLGANVMYRAEPEKSEGLTAFASVAQSKTKPNNHVFSVPFYSVDNGATFLPGSFGLLNNADPAVPNATGRSHTGTAYYAGLRNDFNDGRTQVGAEYNHGSEYWVGMVPAGDDLWTSKLGTRGDVSEIYLIQHVGSLKKISPFGDAFLRLGYQHYNFDYTGSNNWVGAPMKIADLNAANPAGTQMFAPLKEADDVYLSLEVRF